jgi:putative DNA primase/helicase
MAASMTAANLDEALRAACAQVGIIYRDVPADGHFHRTDTDGDAHGKCDGTIKLFPDGEGGIVCNWRGEQQVFFVDDGLTLSESERHERDQRRGEAMRKAEAAKAGEQADAASKAAAIWKTAKPAPTNHPYLVRKGIKPHGAKVQADEWLLIPMRDAAGKLWNIERIAPEKPADGSTDKKGLFHGKRTGCYCSIGTTKGAAALCIAEGFATGATIHEATGLPVACAMNAGNLLSVARALRAKLPDIRLILCADDDAATEGNPGLTKANEAARAVGGLPAVPDFGTDRQPGHTDFNDMARHCGKDAVRRAVAGVIESARAEYQPDAGNAPAGDSASMELLTPEPGALSETDVTDVTDVQANNGAASSVTADPAADVTDVTPEPIIPDEGKRPCFKVFDDWQPLTDGGKLKPGVWFFGIKAGKKAADPATLTRQWICSPLHIEAVTFDAQDNNFGRLLRFTNTLGRLREFAMPMDMLAGDCVLMRAELLAMGVLIDPHAKDLLTQYLQAMTPKRRVHCALQVGWCDDSFVLPDVVIGPKSSGVIFQSGERGHDEHTRGGTLAGWQSDIAARAVGNPLLTLALSASFAGPMLMRCNGESGGIHFVGDSSTGKTTIIEAACATWGGPNFRRSWRATSNGMEGAAALFNDCLLALDEISECDPREVGAIVYALGNGRGKQRASRTGNARGVTRWRVVVLSSGERSIGTTMAEGGYRAKAGQSVRLLDIPAARRFGAWDELHGLPNGAAFADAIRRAAVTHHGHAGRAFLEKLTRDRRDFCEWLERFKALPMFCADGGEGQDKRTAGRFALLALAGELATEYGITGWQEGAAIEAAAEGFKAWQATRGRGNDERRQILERVSGFIERHGDGRFSDADSMSETVIVRDRAGWWRGTEAGRVYLFNAEGLREALKGFDFKRALDTLQEAGALPKADASGERAKAQRIGGRLVRLYPIQADKVGGDHGA